MVLCIVLYYKVLTRAGTSGCLVMDIRGKTYVYTGRLSVAWEGSKVSGMKEDVSKELLFAQSLERVRGLAREQGNCIREEQVKEEFSALDLNDSQLRMVYDYLEKHKIGIGEPLDSDEFLTEEEKDYLQEYLDGLAALPVYSDGELEAYTISAMAGDKSARQRVMEHYLKDVADIAKLYTGQGVFLEDLIGEGNVALAVGVEMLGSQESPSEAQGMLIKLVMDAMEDFIGENAANAKTDKKVADKVNFVADKAREMAEELHRKVTVKELMDETGLSMKAIQDAIRMSGYKIEDIDAAEE